MKMVGFILSILCALAAGKPQSDTNSIVLGYDQQCWKGPKDLIAQVSAVPVACESAKKCAVFDKVIPLKSKASSYKVSFSEISSKSGLSTDNTILVAAICHDANKNRRCDRNEKPVFQVLRLGGKYLKALYPDGFLTLDFHPVTNAPDYCRSSM